VESVANAEQIDHDEDLEEGVSFCLLRQEWLFIHDF